MWLDYFWVENKYTLTEIQFWMLKEIWFLYSTLQYSLKMSHFMGGIYCPFQPIFDTHTHTYVYNNEHITGVFIIIWDSNLNCPKVGPQSFQGQKN